MKTVDFRSDTVTQPTPAMREAMAAAEVGDDVYDDDPTVNLLEKTAAERTGKEAALFVPSGTMGNQLAIAAHANRGDEVILPENCHIVEHEAGAAAYISGVQLRCLPAYRSEPMDPDDVLRTIRSNPDPLHEPKTALISYENADSDGYVRSLDYMDDIQTIAKLYDIPVHLDGARLFNAATCLSVPASAIARRADSVMFCLSKGLCAPVGSMLCGTKAFIDKARRIRKMLGGGMRQAGFLAAAGLVALSEQTKHLADDHRKARELAARLRFTPGIQVLEPWSDINMVFFELDEFTLGEEQLPAALAEIGIKINGDRDGVFRLVTHHWIEDSDVDRLVDAFQVLAAR